MLVELALVAPILFLILFAVIEFGWVFTQNLDVRHGAREGARLAAVNYDPLSQSGSTQATTILTAACQRMDTAGVTTVRLQFVSTTQTEVGDLFDMQVSVAHQTLTGILDTILDGTTLNSTVRMRLERDAEWAGSSTWTTCP